LPPCSKRIHFAISRPPGIKGRVVRSRGAWRIVPATPFPPQSSTASREIALL
jgi:hypothetical protein